MKADALQVFQEHMNRLGDMLSDALNKMVPGSGKKVGFFLLVFPLANPETPVTFLADGADTDQVIGLLEETVKRLKQERSQQAGHA